MAGHLKILVAYGTRPEAIKLAPVVDELQRRPGLEVTVCFTGQHREMVLSVLRFFEQRVDVDLDIMRPDQSLNGITSRAIDGIDAVLERVRPDWTVVQGDTTTALACALASSNRQVRVAHVEAGLRSFDRRKPFPEEMNRILVGHIADLHFCPTERARENLLREGIGAEQARVVGNTVIDALRLATERLGRPATAAEADRALPALRPGLPLLLVTGHRRESFGAPFRSLCEAIREVARSGRVDVVYPVHLNPNVRAPVFELLAGLPNVHLVEPVDYPVLVRLLQRCRFVLTDSGGIQEEAAAMGRPVLVMRDVTERQESVDAGVSCLVGTDRGRIVEWCRRLLDDEATYAAMARAVDVYGDGHASVRIADGLLEAT